MLFPLLSSIAPVPKHLTPAHTEGHCGSLHRCATWRELQANSSKFIKGTRPYWHPPFPSCGNPSSSTSPALLPGSDEQVLISSQRQCLGWTRGCSFQEPELLLLLSRLCKLPLEHIALFAPKFMLISLCFNIKS